MRITPSKALIILVASCSASRVMLQESSEWTEGCKVGVPCNVQPISPPDTIDTPTNYLKSNNARPEELAEPQIVTADNPVHNPEGDKIEKGQREVKIVGFDRRMNVPYFFLVMLMIMTWIIGLISAIVMIGLSKYEKSGQFLDSQPSQPEESSEYDIDENVEKRPLAGTNVPEK